MKNSVIRSIVNNKFLPNYDNIKDFFQKNNLVYSQEDKIDGGFVLDFIPTDSKELFEQNLKTQPEDWYYRTYEVKYTLNSLGYRTKEFDDIDWSESIVMFGCSHVFGTGVTDEHTIPYFLEKLSGRPVINMGIGGSSIQFALHNSIILNDSKYPIPKAVIYLFSDLNRFQLYKNNSIQHVGPWSDIKNTQTFLTEDHIIPFNLILIKMIRNLWKNKTIYYECNIIHQQHALINQLDTEIRCEFLSLFRPKELPHRHYARDLAHAGPISNMKFAKKIYEKIKPQLDN